MRKRSLAVVALLATLVAQPGTAEEIPRIVDVRAGRHRSFDRIVIELDRRAAAFALSAPPGEAVFELRARALLPHQELPTGFPRMQRVVLEGLVEGTRIHVSSPGGAVRSFLLRDPPRLVIDVADPGVRHFEPPPGTGLVPPVPPEVVTPRPEPVPEVPDVSTEPAPEPPEAPAVIPVPEEAISEETPQPAEETGPEEPGGPVEEAPEEVATEAEAEAPELESPVPASTEPPQEEPTWVPAEPSPVTPALPVPMPPEPRPSPSPLRPPQGGWPVVLIWVGGLLAVAALGLYWMRVRTRSDAKTPEARAPESITPEEVLSASDRLDLLEKRIDEEVRARMQLEGRVVQVQEDLKVVRDRVGRIARRGEGAS
jgi:hypothetical protein